MRRFLTVMAMGLLFATPVLAQQLRASTAPPVSQPPGAFAANPEPQTPAPAPPPAVASQRAQPATPPTPPGQPPVAPVAPQPGQKSRATTPAAPVATPPPAPRAPFVATQNVRLELAITDASAAGASTKKVVTMMIADGGQGRIRSTNDVPVANQFNSSMPVSYSYRTITINVDAIPLVRAESRIQLDLTVEYAPEVSSAPPGNTGAPAPKTASINESLRVLLADGKPMLISQSADPATDRKVTVEVTATIVK